MMSVQQILITVNMVVPTLLVVFFVNATLDTGCTVMVEHVEVCAIKFIVMLSYKILYSSNFAKTFTTEMNNTFYKYHSSRYYIYRATVS